MHTIQRFFVRATAFAAFLAFAAIGFDEAKAINMKMDTALGQINLAIDTVASTGLTFRTVSRDYRFVSSQNGGNNDARASTRAAGDAGAAGLRMGLGLDADATDAQVLTQIGISTAADVGAAVVAGIGAAAMVDSRPTIVPFTSVGFGTYAGSGRISTKDGSQKNFASSGNVDDGRLNFDKGDITGLTFKTLTDIQAGLSSEWGEFTAFARVVAYADPILRDGSFYERIGPDDAAKRELGRDLKILDGYLSWDGNIPTGSDMMGDLPFNLRVGKLTATNWGEATFSLSGISAGIIVDVPSARRAGAEIKEIIQPDYMVYASIGLPYDIGLDAYYQFHHSIWNLDVGGSPTATGDLGNPGNVAGEYLWLSSTSGSGTFRDNCSAGGSPFRAAVARAAAADAVLPVILNPDGTACTEDDITHYTTQFDEIAGAAELLRLENGDLNRGGRVQFTDADDQGQWGVQLSYYVDSFYLIPPLPIPCMLPRAMCKRIGGFLEDGLTLPGVEFNFSYQNIHSRVPYVRYSSGGRPVVTKAIIGSSSTSSIALQTVGCIGGGDGIAGLLTALSASEFADMVPDGAGGMMPNPIPADTRTAVQNVAAAFGMNRGDNVVEDDPATMGVNENTVAESARTGAIATTLGAVFGPGYLLSGRFRDTSVRASQNTIDPGNGMGFVTRSDPSAFALFDAATAEVVDPGNTRSALQDADILRLDLDPRHFRTAGVQTFSRLLDDGTREVTPTDVVRAGMGDLLSYARAADDVLEAWFAGTNPPIIVGVAGTLSLTPAQVGAGLVALAAVAGGTGSLGDNVMGSTTVTLQILSDTLTAVQTAVAATYAANTIAGSVTANGANRYDIARIVCAQALTQTGIAALLGGGGSAASVLPVVGTEYLAIQYTPQVELYYPENIQVIGGSFNTTIPWLEWGIQGEISWRPNMPLQVDVTEQIIATSAAQGGGLALGDVPRFSLAAAVTTGVDATLSTADANSYYNDIAGSGGPAALFNRAFHPSFYEDYTQGTILPRSEFEAEMLNITIGTTALYNNSHPVVNLLGADQAVLLLEFNVITFLDDLPEGWGGGGTVINRSQKLFTLHCIARSGTELPLGGLVGLDDVNDFRCSPDETSLGYTILGFLDYNNVFGTAWRLRPQIAVRHGPYGNTPSPIPGWREDTLTVNFSLGANFQNTWAVQAGYLAYWDVGSNDYNANSGFDRFSFNISYAF